MNSCLEAKTAQGVLVSSLEAGPHHDLKVSNSKIVYISSICFQQTTNNFWSTYQYYEVWRQSNHEVWRTLSKLLHQFLNLDIVNSQSRRACISRCHPMMKSYEVCIFYVGSHKKTNYIHLNQN